MKGMFDEGGAMLGWWSCNDGGWRGEYFDPFLEAAGIHVVYDQGQDKDLFKRLRKKLDGAAK